MQKRRYSKPRLDRREAITGITAQVVKTSGPLADS